MTHHPVTTAAKRDRNALASLLAKAFIDEPAMSWMVPNEEDRRRTFDRFFRAIVAGSLRNGIVLHTPDNRAVTLWRLPDQPSPSLYETLTGLPYMLPLLRCAGAKAKLMSEAVRQHWPRVPFRYLQFAGVEPGYQGKGMGGAVIKSGLTLAQKAGDPVYLETAKPQNVALYQALGFEIIDEWTIDGSPLVFRSMLKES